MLFLRRANSLVRAIMGLDLLDCIGRVVLVLSRLRRTVGFAVRDALGDQAVITDCAGGSFCRTFRTRAAHQQEWGDHEHR